MAVIEYDSYKQKLLAMSDTFENLQKALDIESSKHEIARLEAEAVDVTLPGPARGEADRGGPPHDAALR